MKYEIRRRLRQILGLERTIVSKPINLELSDSDSVLVISPHSDDEVLGCGGLLMRCREESIPVYWLIVSDGREGTAFSTLRNDELMLRRKDESRAAAKILEVRSCEFLDFKDTHLKNDKETREGITQALSDVDPSWVLIPYVYDAHKDHTETALAAIDVLIDRSFRGRVLMYEVWTPLPANRVISIDWKEKENLIAQYQTQLGDGQFCIDGASSLARYRSMTALNNPSGYAECFLELTLDELGCLR